MYWIKRLVLPLLFFTVAFAIEQLVPKSWGDRDALALIVAMLGAMILGADLIVLALGRVFNPYSHLWSFVIAPGTILHELGHYLACQLVGAQVKEFAPFSPNPHTGQLGYVKFSLKREHANWSVIQGLIIAMAPFVSGAAALTGLVYLIAPELKLPELNFTTMLTLNNEIKNLYAVLEEAILRDDRLGVGKYFAIYGLLVIGSGAAPSTEDFLIPFKQSARAWLGAIFALVFLSTLAASVLFIPKVGATLVSVLAIAIACQLVSLSGVLSVRALVSVIGLFGGRKKD